MRSFLQQELSVARLNSIHRHLWWAGRPGNIHPLHRQLMLHRRILVTEDASLHLVWYDSTIFVKPLPAFLLDWELVARHVCPDAGVYGLAAGLLLTYARLVRHVSDYRIARELGLLPAHVSWSAWCAVAGELGRIPARDVNERYVFGELRLPRLNHIWRFCRWKMRYFSPYTEYRHFFVKNFAWFVVMFACLSVVLSAIQVVISTPAGVGEEAVVRFAYGFAMFAIALTLGAVVVVGGLFAMLFVYFLQRTVRETGRYLRGLERREEKC